MNDRRRGIASRRCIHDLLILGGIGLLSAAAWAASAGAGMEHGSRGSHGEAGLEEGSERRFWVRGEYRGNAFPLSEEVESFLFPGEPQLSLAPPDTFPGGEGEGTPQFLIPADHEGPLSHLIPGHHPGPADHHHAHVVVPVHAGQAEIPQHPAHTGGESDDAGAATAQPDPTASLPYRVPARRRDDGGAATAQPNPTATPAFQFPPGATGPGRRMSGWPGPGRPGPGRRTRPRR